MMRLWLMLVGCVIFVTSLGCAFQAGSPDGELVGSSRSAISEGGTEGGGACTNATLTTTQSSPQTAGTAITINAGSSTCANPLYEFWMLPPGSSTYTIIQPFSTTPSVTWTSDTTVGDYLLEVWVKDASSSTTNWDTDAVLGFTINASGAQTCTAATLTPTLASPQDEGTAVTLNASSSSCGSPQYEFWMLTPGSSSWSILQPYSSSASFNWTSDATPGEYFLQVWVKDATSSTTTYDTYSIESYTIVVPQNCTNATLTAMQGSPQAVGTAITLNAGSSTCASPLYEFWMLAPGSSTYVILQSYSSSASVTWTSDTTVGDYILEVWVKDANSSTTNWDTDAVLGYTISATGAQTCSNATLTATPASPQVAGTSVTLNAGSSGCSNPQYEFWMLTPGSSTYTVIQSYSSSASVTWTSDTTLGDYILEVWVKDATSTTSNWDTDAILGYTIPGATAIASGLFYTCALLTTGTVECWGYNADGELGDGTTSGPNTCAGSEACSMTPVAVSSLTGATAISTNQSDSPCALLSGGNVECWGYNADGELGDGTTTNSSTPMAASSLTGVTALAAGYSVSCAVMSDSTVECWGDNSYGELGGGTATGPDTCGGFACSTTPVAVPGLTGVTAISVGTYHACALLSGGTVECWGYNAHGELGNGSSTGPSTCNGTNGTAACSATPVAVSGLTGVTAISAGYEQTCALLSGGTVECWGYNADGELGNGMTTSSSTPVAVSSLTGVTAVAAGGTLTCALLTGGTVDCWGDNTNGELGIGTTTGPSTCNGGTTACSTTPVAVSGLTGVTAVSSGDQTVCALLSGGSVECWGYNGDGELGNGTTTNSSTPVVVSTL
jgi:alpha-tubulin suppressor-like RCC1 family protein